MGCRIFLTKSNAQLQQHIRTVAKTSASVFITRHAKARMKIRGIGIGELYDVLRNGVIERPPQPNEKRGSLECRMQRYVGGRECAVVVALDDEDPDLIVVTVMETGH